MIDGANADMRKFRLIAAVYFLGLFFMGLAHIAILPPYEGIDEIAYYAAIRQIADVGVLPVYGQSFFPEDVANYTGPMPYDSQKPPYDRGMTYAKFFAQPELSYPYMQDYRQPYPHPIYKGDPHSPNWEAQHPPLYYLLMAGVMKWTDGIPFVDETLVLRLVSYLLVLGGVMFGFAAAAHQDRHSGRKTAIAGFLLYPLLLPIFFTDFTRIGNDSLCVLLNGMTAFFMARSFTDERSPWWPLVAGITIGLGLLTKAYFLAVVFALAVYLLIRSRRERRDSGLQRQRQRWRNLAIIVLTSLLIGGGWYIYKLMTVGQITGAGESIMLAAKGGWAENFIQNFSLGEMLQGVLVLFVTGVWAGTWSLTLPPFVAVIPLLVAVGWVMGASVLAVREKTLKDSLWLPVFLFAAMAGSLFYYTLMSIAVYGKGNIIPGYYMHILMPWIAPLLGLGINAISAKKRRRHMLTALLLYSVIFQIAIFWAQIALFTGCAIKGDTKMYAFTAPDFCLGQFSILIDRLAVLGWPGMAALGFGGGLACALWLFWIYCRRGRTEA